MRFYELCSVKLKSIRSAKYLDITIIHDQHGLDLHGRRPIVPWCARHSTIVQAFGIPIYSWTYLHWKRSANPLFLSYVTNPAGTGMWALLLPVHTKELAWSSFQDRQYHQGMVVVYNILHGIMAVSPKELTRPQRSTRSHSYKYQAIGTNSNCTKFSFYPPRIPQWNNFSDNIVNVNIVNAPSLDSLKSRLYKY